QPIIDNVQEAVAGMNANNAVKIFGDDLTVLDTLADHVLQEIKDIAGVKDIGIMKNIGQPEMSIILDEQKMAVYGITTADCQAVVEMALGGKTASQMYEGERKFDIRIRYQPEYRKSEDEINLLMVPTIRGSKIPLKEIAQVKTVTGPAFIYRDNNK